MGFSMIVETHGCCSLKKFKKTRKAAKLLGWAAFGLVLISCKLPDEDVNTQLKPAKQSDIEDVLYAELQKMNVLDFKVGQQAQYEMNYRVEMSGVSKLQDVLRSVFSVDPSSDGKELKVSMREDYFEWNSDGSVKDEKHSDVIWRLNTTPENNTVSSQALRTAAFSDLKANSEDDPTTPEEPELVYQYYNLSHRPVIIAAPKLTNEKADCGGLQDCVLHGTEVNYIVKVLQDGKVVAKAEQQTIISRDVPPLFLFDENYILPIYSDCLSRVIDDKYFVTTCMVLRDLQK